MCVCVSVLVVERLLLMLSSAVRIAIICGTETCGWLRTERDVEWRNVIGHRTLSGKTCLRLVNVFAFTCHNDRKLLSNFTLYSMM